MNDPQPPPGLYRMNFRGLTLGEAWRLAGNPFTFLIALGFKLVGTAGTRCRLPSYLAEAPCAREDIPETGHAELLREIDAAVALGYRDGRCTRQTENHDPNTLDGFAYTALHDDRRRTVFLGSLRNRTDDGTTTRVIVTGALRCADPGDVEFVNHRLYLDCPPPMRRVRVSAPGVAGVDAAMRAHLVAHPAVPFADHEAMRAHIRATIDRAEAWRVRRGLFRPEQAG